MTHDTKVESSSMIGVDNLSMVLDSHLAAFELDAFAYIQQLVRGDIATCLRALNSASAPSTPSTTLANVASVTSQQQQQTNTFLRAPTLDCLRLYAPYRLDRIVQWMIDWRSRITNAPSSLPSPDHQPLHSLAVDIVFTRAILILVSHSSASSSAMSPSEPATPRAGSGVADKPVYPATNLNNDACAVLETAALQFFQQQWPACPRETKTGGLLGLFRRSALPGPGSPLSAKSAVTALSDLSSPKSSLLFSPNHTPAPSHLAFPTALPSASSSSGQGNANGSQDASVIAAEIADKQIHMHTRLSELWSVLIGLLSLSPQRAATISSRFITATQACFRVSTSDAAKPARIIRGLLCVRLDITNAENLANSQKTLAALVAFFKGKKSGSRGKGRKGGKSNGTGSSQMRRALCMVLHNMLWPAADHPWDDKLNYTEWQSLLLSLLKSTKTWLSSKPKAENARLACPLITSLLCACARDYFLIEYAAVIDRLIAAYQDSATRTVAAGCVQRLLHVYLAKMTDRKETTIAALEQLTQQLLLRGTLPVPRNKGAVVSMSQAHIAGLSSPSVVGRMESFDTEFATPTKASKKDKEAFILGDAVPSLVSIILTAASSFSAPSPTSTPLLLRFASKQMCAALLAHICSEEKRTKGQVEMVTEHDLVGLAALSAMLRNVVFSDEKTSDASIAASVAHKSRRISMMVGSHTESKQPAVGNPARIGSEADPSDEDEIEAAPPALLVPSSDMILADLRDNVRVVVTDALRHGEPLVETEVADTVWRVLSRCWPSVGGYVMNAPVGSPTNGEEALARRTITVRALAEAIWCVPAVWPLWSLDTGAQVINMLVSSLVHEHAGVREASSWALQQLIIGGGQSLTSGDHEVKLDVGRRNELRSRIVAEVARSVCAMRPPAVAAPDHDQVAFSSPMQRLLHHCNALLQLWIRAQATDEAASTLSIRDSANIESAALLALCAPHPPTRLRALEVLASVDALAIVQRPPPASAPEIKEAGDSKRGDAQDEQAPANGDTAAAPALVHAPTHVSMFATEARTISVMGVLEYAESLMVVPNGAYTAAPSHSLSTFLANRNTDGRVSGNNTASPLATITRIRNAACGAPQTTAAGEAAREDNWGITWAHVLRCLVAAATQRGGLPQLGNSVDLALSRLDFLTQHLRPHIIATPKPPKASKKSKVASPASVQSVGSPVRPSKLANRNGGAPGFKTPLKKKPDAVKSPQHTAGTAAMVGTIPEAVVECRWRNYALLATIGSLCTCDEDTEDTVGRRSDVTLLLHELLVSSSIEARTIASTVLGRVHRSGMEIALGVVKLLQTELTNAQLSKSAQVRASKDFMRPHLAHVYELLAQRLNVNDFNLGSQVREPFTLFIKDTLAYLWQEANEFDWSLQSMRISLCTLVLAITKLLDGPQATTPAPLYPSLSSLTSQPSSSSLTENKETKEVKREESGVSSQLRKALFNLLLPWCGHGPDSRDFIAKVRASFDSCIRAGQAPPIPFHSSMRPLHDGALQAMVALVRGQCFDEELLEEQVNKNGNNTSNDSPVLSWINALLASNTPAVRHTGSDALSSLIQGNQWLLPALLNYCYSTSLETSRRYYLVVGAMFLANGIATGDSAKNVGTNGGLYLPMPSLLLLVLFKLSDPSPDVRAMSLQLLPKLSLRVGTVNSAVSSDLRDTYTHTQTQLSKRLAMEHGSRYARVMIGEGSYRVQMLRDPFQRHDVLRLLVPWMAYITLKPLSADHTGIAARKMFRTLMDLSKYCAHSPYVLEQLWQALAAGHPDNAQHVLDFFLDAHHGLATFDAPQLEGAKQIVVHLSRARPWTTLTCLATALFVPGAKDGDVDAPSLSSHHRTSSQPGVASLLATPAPSSTVVGGSSNGAPSSPPRSSSPGRSPSRSVAAAAATGSPAPAGSPVRREAKDDSSLSSPSTIATSPLTGSALTSSAALRRPSYALMLLVEAVYELQLNRLIPVTPTPATAANSGNALIGSITSVRDLIGLLLHMGALGLQSAQTIVRGQSARLLLNLIHALLTNSSTNTLATLAPEPLWCTPGTEMTLAQPHSPEATRVMNRLQAMHTECTEGVNDVTRGRKFTEEEVGSVIGDCITVIAPSLLLSTTGLAQAWAELALQCAASPALTARSFQVYRLLPLGLGIARHEHLTMALGALDHCLRGHNAHVATQPAATSGGRSPQLTLLTEMLVTVQSMIKGVTSSAVLTVDVLARSLWTAVSLLWNELVIYSNPALTGSTGLATISNPALVDASLSLVDTVLHAIPRERATFVEEVMSLMPMYWSIAAEPNFTFSGLQPLLLRSLPLFTPSRTLNGPSLSSVCTLLAKMTALPFGSLIDTSESTRLSMALTALVPWLSLHAHQFPEGAEDENGRRIVNKDIRPPQISMACPIIATRCELAGASLMPIARAVRRLQRGHYAASVANKAVTDGAARAFMVDVLVPLCATIEPQCVGTILAMLTGLLPRPTFGTAAAVAQPATAIANMEFRYHTHVLSLLSGVVGLSDWHWLTLPTSGSAGAVTPASPAPSVAARSVGVTLASPGPRGPVRLPPPITPSGNAVAVAATPATPAAASAANGKVATFFPFFRIIGSLLQTPLRGHASLLLDAALSRGAGVHRRSSSVVSQALRQHGGVIPPSGMPTTPRSRASVAFGVAMPSAPVPPTPSVLGPRPSIAAFATPAAVASSSSSGSYAAATPAPILFSPAAVTPHHARGRSTQDLTGVVIPTAGSDNHTARSFPSLPRNYSVVVTPPSPTGEDSKDEKFIGNGNEVRPLPVFQPVDQSISDATPRVAIPEPSAPPAPTGLPVAQATPVDMPPAYAPYASSSPAPVPVTVAPTPSSYLSPSARQSVMSPGGTVRSPAGVTSPGRTPKRHVRISSLEWMNDLGSPEQPEAEHNRRKSREAALEHESAVKRKISQDLGEFDAAEHQQLMAALTAAADNAEQMEQSEIYDEARSDDDGNDTTDDDDDKRDSQRSRSGRRSRRNSTSRSRNARDEEDDVVADVAPPAHHEEDDKPRYGRSVSVFSSPPPRPPKPALSRGMSFSGTPSGGLLAKGGYSQPYVDANGSIVFSPVGVAQPPVQQATSTAVAPVTPDGRVVSFSAATQLVSANDVVSVGQVHLASPPSRHGHQRQDSVDIAERAKQLKSLLVSPLAPEPRPRPLIRSPSPQPGAARASVTSPQVSARVSQFAQSPQGQALNALISRSPTVPGQETPEPMTMALLVQSAREAAARRKGSKQMMEEKEPESEGDDSSAAPPSIPGVRLSRPKVSGRKKRVTNSRKWQAAQRKSLEKQRPPGASSIVIVSNGSHGSGVRVTVSPQPGSVSPQQTDSNGQRLPLSPRAPQYHTQLPTPPKAMVQTVASTPSKALNGISSHPYAAMYASPAATTPKVPYTPVTPVTPGGRRRSDVFMTPTGPIDHHDYRDKENLQRV